MFKSVSPKLNVNEMEESILKFWNDEEIFKKSTENRKGGREYIFFEGPPTANGKPGVHHVLARSFKEDLGLADAVKGISVDVEEFRKAGDMKSWREIDTQLREALNAGRVQ